MLKIVKIEINPLHENLLTPPFRSFVLDTSAPSSLYLTSKQGLFKKQKFLMQIRKEEVPYGSEFKGTAEKEGNRCAE